MELTAEGMDDELARAYVECRPDLESSAEQLEETLREAMGRLPDGRLVRAHLPRPLSREVTGNPRIKSLESLRRKAEEQDWGPEEAIRKAPDLVGGRVVCNNVEDVYRVAALIEELAAPVDGPPIRREDYIDEPQPSGYRSLHLYVPVDVSEEVVPRYVTCEVQVRTLLQHAWAELSHEDIYKFGEGLPDDLEARFRDLGRILAAADEQAGEVRERVLQLRPSPEGRPDLSTVTDEGLIFLFATTFGREPADYEIRAARNMCERESLASLKPLEEVLADAEIRRQLAAAYEEEVSWPIELGEVFELLLVVASRGREAAVSEAARRGREAWRELDERFREEMLGELPESFDTFLEELLETLHIFAVADGLGATTDCAICGTDLIDPELFAEQICEHYGEDDWEPILELLNAGGVATVAPGSSGLCNYHAHLLAKDD